MTRLILIFCLLTLITGCSSFSRSSNDKPLTKENVVPPAPKAGTTAIAKTQPSGKAESGKRQTQKINSVAKIKATAKSMLESVKIVKADDDLWAQLRKGFDLPELKSDRVSHYERYFTRRPENFYAMVERSRLFLPYILAEVEKRNFPTELALLPAVESGFITKAKSRSSASGLWQFIPSTGRLYNLKQNSWYDGRRDPVLSTQAALKFLGQLDKRFEGNWFHAIAAYNAGGRTLELAIEKAARKGRSTDFIDLPLRRETRDYVPKLIAFRNVFLNPEKFGLKLPKLNTRKQFASLDAGSQIDLNLFMSLTDIDRGTFRVLNSAYYRNVTPPEGPHWLHVPIDKYDNAKIKLAELSTKDRLRWTQYLVKKGDVLGNIAKRYDVSVAGIMQSNKLKSNTIHPGKVLLIPASAVRNALVGGAAPARLAVVKNNKAPTSSGNSKFTHRVRSGDTLWDIAQRYGVKVAQISQWNQLNHANTLQLGQELTIYKPS